MKHLLAALLLALASLLAAEEVNLLANGKLSCEQGSFPECWTARDTSIFTYSRTGGHDNGPFIEMTGDGEKQERTVQQFNLKLVPGESYKVSVWVRTRGFVSSHCGVIALDAGWTASRGLKAGKFPRDTNGKWVYCEEVIPKMIPSKNNTYRFAMFAVNQQGSIAFSDVKLIPLSQAAIDGPSSPQGAQARRLPYALDANLWDLPQFRARPRFRYPYFPGRRRTVRYEVSGRTGAATLEKDDVFAIDLAALAPGEYVLNLTAFAPDGKEAGRVTQPVRIVPAAAIPLPSHPARRLNNQVHELARRDFAKSADGELGFSVFRHGWVWICGEGALALDGKPLPPHETFVKLAPGDYRLAYRGATGLLRVHAVPQLSCNFPGTREVSTNFADPLMTLDIIYRHLGRTNHAVGVGGANRVPAHLQKWKDLGRDFLCTVPLAPLDANPDAAKFTETLRQQDRRLPSADFALDLDEIGFYQGDQKFQALAEALRAAGTGMDREFYVCVIARPHSAVHAEFISAVLNAGRGRGYLRLEQYLFQQKTLAETEKYLDQHYDLSSFEKTFPGSLRHLQILLGVVDYPRFMMTHYPEIDNKVFMDMQMHRIATRPGLQDIQGIGLYGTHRCSEETFRWCMALYRHYFVEGNTAPLAEQFGFTYRPGHIQNPDFEQGLDHWTATGAVAAGRVPGFGRRERWASDGSRGDKFCVMTKSAEKENRIVQKATGLVPGRLYSIRFIVADYDYLLQNNNAITRYDNRAFVAPEDGELIPALASAHIHTDNATRNKANYARINDKRFVFRAKKSEALIGIGDWRSEAEPGSRVGQRTAFHFIQVLPYYEDTPAAGPFRRE